MIHVDLGKLAWMVRAVGDLSRVPEALRSRVSEPIPAVVPGCVHEDLIRAGIIGDPRVGMNEELCAWVGWVDWRYEAEVEASAALFEHDEIELVFECLDTVASIELNGLPVGEAASEFVPHRFGVAESLKPGVNTLAVTFASPLRHIEAESARLGPRTVNGDWAPYNMVRKCASSFEWDWGPRVAGCGIGAPVRLEAWSRLRAGIEIEYDGDPMRDTFGVVATSPILHWSSCAELPSAMRWHCRVFFQGQEELIGDSDTPASIPGDARAASIQENMSGGAVLVPVILDARFWDPRRAGAQPIYSMELRLQTHETDNVSLVEPLATSTFGLRTIVWTGDGFVLNGSPLFCLGANWIPEGLFPSDRTIEKVRERLQAARDCGMNMIRVWGGGRYEPDWFYDICDELGLMVWQDFMFACACYPEEEPLRSLVEAEARHQVARLSRHPSVVLWCGGNENHWAYQSWGDGGEGFKARLAPGQTWGHGYWHELLPKVIAEVDPSRPYWPDSPWSGDEAVHPNAPDHGDRHSWDVNFWNVWDGGYQKFVPRFCSEFGQQSPSNYATLVQAGLVPLPEGEGGLSPSASGARAVRGDRSTDASDAIENSGVMESTLPNPSLGEGLSESWSAKLMGRMLAHRQRGPGGNRRWYDEPIDAVFRRPRDFDEWHYTAQVIQARAMRTAVEWHRVNRPRCMGALVWQLNDAWPGLSWSLIDSAGRKKPAWYAVRAAMRPRILSIHLVEGELVLFAVNDTDEPWRDTAHATMVGFRGEQPANSRRAPFAVEPRSVGRVMRLDGLVTDASTQLISAMCDSGEENLTAMHFMAADRTLRYPELLLQLDVTSANGRIKIAMAAPAVARDIVLAVDRIDPAAECDDQAFTLVPHEPRAVYIRTGVSIERWRREIRSHICCANALGGG